MWEECQSCPVLQECSAYALLNKVSGGFWAGRHRDPFAPEQLALLVAADRARESA